MSYWKDFQWRLWVLEVTYHFNAGAVNITSHLRVIDFVISMFFLAANLRETASQLVAAARSGRLEECNQTGSLSVFFRLSWLSIDIWLGNEPYNSKIFWSWLSRELEKSVANSWERERGREIVRITTKSWDLASQDNLGLGRNLNQIWKLKRQIQLYS